MNFSCTALRALRGLLVLPLLAVLSTPVVRADALEEIQRRGVLVVGVKRDVPLWGQAHPQTGVPVGLEPDLAADLARRLGVKLQLVGLITAERIDAIEQRRVDLLIATLSDTTERRLRMTMVMPHYYASGVNILARRSSAFRDWSDLRNRRVCGRRGAFYNRSITVTSGVDLVALYNNSLALAALRDGRCDGLLYDDTNIVAMLQERQWSGDFEMPLRTLFVAPWAVAVHRTEAGGRLEAAVSLAIIDWHRTGLVVAFERKWGIPVSEFSRRMNAAWGRQAKGGFACGDRIDEKTPKECL